MLLSDVNSDEDVIAQSLQSYLQNNSDTFKALFPGETSTALVQIAAGLTAMMLYRIDANLLNQYMSTAFSKSAIYTLSSFLGSPPLRMKGASLTITCTINTTITTAITIPAYTRFSGRSTQWYTTSSATVLPGQTSLTLTIKQGTVSNLSTTSNGQAYQSIYIGSGFSIDRESIKLYVGTTLWNNVTESLFDSQGANDYLETTTPDGQVLLLFGNGLYGNIPSGASTISVQYATTTGTAANSSVIGDSFILLDNITVGTSTLSLTSVSSSSTTGGSSQSSTDEVKFTSPRLFAANKRAVRRQDYNAYILRYGGFASAATWGEYEQALETGTASVTMMNVAYISALFSSTTSPVYLLGTGNSSTTTFSGTITSSSVPIIPGSVTVYAGVTPGLSGEVTFRDNDGLGLLCSADQTVNVLTSGTGGTSGSASGYAVSNAYDGNTVDWWRSSTNPATTVTTIGYDLGSGHSAVFSAIRLWSATALETDSRAFPNKIAIYASNSATPDFTTTTDWTLLRGGVFLSDPGPGWRSDWVPFANATAYRSLMVVVQSNWGSKTYTQVSRLECQALSSLGSINYSTGVISVNFTTAPATSTPVNVMTLSNDLSSTNQSDLLSYINDYTQFTTQLSYVSPIAQQYNVVLDIYVKLAYSTTAVKSLVIAAVQALFAYNQSSIGKVITTSDIYEAVTGVNGVDYCNVQSPVTDYHAYRHTFPYLVDTIVNTYYTDRS